MRIQYFKYRHQREKQHTTKKLSNILKEHFTHASNRRFTIVVLFFLLHTRSHSFIGSTVFSPAFFSIVLAVSDVSMFARLCSIVDVTTAQSASKRAQ